MSAIVKSVKDSIKEAMRARAKARLLVLRNISSEFKKVEVDERVEVDDARAILILDKMQKQRRDSISQYELAGRDDLAALEKTELEVISTFLPAALSEQELTDLVASAIAQVGASSMADMGKVMAIIKPQTVGRADNGQVSKQVKALLTA
ncbi:MAG: GatB/YqeY domain-containing protein [Saccharospirillaceae bacterium]|nr:GatB/YqeY domain-containing protein [Pseudomonadales bacterium]NRB79520.1 GatB/YqeY domain-containing protein [Saccharospirillaceae bacterium]